MDKGQASVRLPRYNLSWFRVERFHFLGSLRTYDIQVHVLRFEEQQQVSNLREASMIRMANLENGRAYVNNSAAKYQMNPAE